jgi:DNA-binding Lrp family transcriptional regulator
MQIFVTCATFSSQVDDSRDPCFHRAVTDRTACAPPSERDQPPVVLDQIDRAIVRELQENGRASYGRIAAAVGLTEAPARQRVARLLRTGAVEIVAITNPAAFGFLMRATLGLHCDGSPDEVAAALESVAEIDWLAGTAARFDLLAEVRCRDEQHLYSLLVDRIRSVPGVRRVETMIHLNRVKTAYPWPPGAARNGPAAAGVPRALAAERAGLRQPPVPPAPGGIVLDETDHAIIGQLQQDGRRTYGRIADAVGLTLVPTRQRVVRLIESDVIRIAAILNPAVRDVRLRATVALRCEGDLDGIAARLAAIDEIPSLVATAGRYELLAEVECDDEQHLYRLLTSRIRAVPGVHTVQAMVLLHVFKIRYPWPPNLARTDLTT